MLDGLNTIDWHSLTHAYGPADDVPETLLALASGEASAEEAAEIFWGSIWHQGTVYEATAYAVPFLIEILESRRVTDKEWLLLLLSHLATGSSHGAPDGELWVQQAHEAVRQGTPVYLSLLGSHRPPVRTAAARALSCFPESAREIVPQIRPFLIREKNRDARASLMLCSGALSDPDPAVHRLLEAALTGGPTDSQRLAAAIGLVWRDKEKASREAVRILQETLADPENFSEAFVFNVWDIDADPGVVLYEVIGCLGRDRAAATLIKLLGKMEEPIDSLVDALIDTAFEEHQGKTIALEMLSPLQKNVLTALLAADTVWDQNQQWLTHSMGTREWQYGLPLHRAAVAQLVKEADG